MDHGIREGFKQGHLDVDFTSIRHSKVQNEPHELIDEWGDESDSAWERLAQLNVRGRMISAGQKRERVSVSHSCYNLHLKFPCHRSCRRQGSCQISLNRSDICHEPCLLHERCHGNFKLGMEQL